MIRGALFRDAHQFASICINFCINHFKYIFLYIPAYTCSNTPLQHKKHCIYSRLPYLFQVYCMYYGCANRNLRNLKDFCINSLHQLHHLHQFASPLASICISCINLHHPLHQCASAASICITPCINLHQFILLL